MMIRCELVYFISDKLISQIRFTFFLGHSSWCFWEMSTYGIYKSDEYIRDNDHTLCRRLKMRTLNWLSFWLFDVLLLIFFYQRFTRLHDWLSFTDFSFQICHSEKMFFPSKYFVLVSFNYDVCNSSANFIDHILLQASIKFISLSVSLVMYIFCIPTLWTCWDFFSFHNCQLFK